MNCMHVGVGKSASLFTSVHDISIYVCIIKTKIIGKRVMNALPKSVYDGMTHTIYGLLPIVTVIIVILLLLLLLLLYGSIPGLHKSLASGRCNNKTSYGGAQYFWTLSTQLASCHPPGASKFEVGLIFLENVCTPGFHTCSIWL